MGLALLFKNAVRMVGVCGLGLLLLGLGLARLGLALLCNTAVGMWVGDLVCLLLEICSARLCLVLLFGGFVGVGLALLSFRLVGLALLWGSPSGVWWGAVGGLRSGLGLVGRVVLVGVGEVGQGGFGLACRLDSSPAF